LNFRRKIRKKIKYKDILQSDDFTITSGKLLSHILSTTLLSGIEIGNFTFLEFQFQEK